MEKNIQLGYSEGNQVGIMVYAKLPKETEWQPVQLLRWGDNTDYLARCGDFTAHAIKQGFIVENVQHNIAV